MWMEEMVLTSEDSNLKSHYESVIGGFEPASHRDSWHFIFQWLFLFHFFFGGI